VAGDEIIFEDNLVGEKLGEFPSQWDLIEGNADVAKVNGENVINLEQWTKIAPLMKNMKNYLSDSYTVEFDFYVPAEDKGSRFFFHLKDESGKDAIYAEWVLRNENDGDGIRYLAKWKTTSGDERENASKFSIAKAGWHKFALSFNKRALKTYIDGQRITNVPNVVQANSLVLEHYYGEQDVYVKNIRIAKGAVPLYDRMMTDGKIITYGITFDIGKSTIKPESMGEINRIAKLMTDNPGLKFSVEGHTDNTGSAATNQTLSDARSKAVVDKLVEMGVAKDRLTSAGKGQNSPIADNSTDEGRAKNRRVEFVKVN
jgi:outer membrane protein OmpA-like peptidoglycan-associated protein